MRTNVRLLHMRFSPHLYTNLPLRAVIPCGTGGFGLLGVVFSATKSPPRDAIVGYP